MLLPMASLTRRLAALAAVSCLVSLQASASQGDAGAKVRMPSSMGAGVTVYGASWCGPCRKLEADLKARDIPFDEIDVDRNPQAFERARQATGTGAIPQTSIDRAGNTVWVVGANADAIERAYRGQ